MCGGSWATGRWSSWPPTRGSWGRSRRRWRRSPRTRPASTATPSWATSCARRLAARHGVPADRVALGNGADALVGYLSTAFLDAGDEVALCWPSFVSYRVAAGKMGADVAAAPLRGSSYDLDALLGAIGPRTRIAYVCNPNNPTGGIVGREQLAAFVAAVPERVLVVVDEAYHEYVEDPELPGRGRRARRRTTTCACCARSRRCTAWPACGSATRSPRRRWQRRSPRCGRPFDVNELAQIAALASMGDTAEIERRRRANTEGRERLGPRSSRARPGAARLPWQLPDRRGGRCAGRSRDGSRRRA